jgi:glycosyltransferase involved in cell wall biosynthesis
LEKHLHIIDFTIPYPVDFGGVFDLFWKLPSLQSEGVQIHLHCFGNGRMEQTELNKFCASVNYYERNEGHKAISRKLPYIVASRKNETLLQNLLKDDHPILMEGVHSTYLLHDERFLHRKKFVRIHNVEHQYYHQLTKSTTSFFKRIYYSREEKLLYNYEQSIVTKANAFWGVTNKDVNYYRNELNCKTIDYLPVYLPNHWGLNCIEGKGNYCLYHGDLSVETNDKAAKWLLKKIFSQLEIPLVIAGKNPSKELEDLAHKHLHTCIVANPSEKEIQDMIGKAHINILPSFSNTGIKLKLLNALFNGKHCIVNHATIEGSDLESLCVITDSEEEMKTKIIEVYKQPFNKEDREKRTKNLSQQFSNEANAKQQVKWIWG